MRLVRKRRHWCAVVLSRIMCSVPPIPPLPRNEPMRRRWRIPPLPPLELRSSDGACVLAEDAAGVGPLLWDLVRDAVRWADSPRGEQRELFAPSAERAHLAGLALAGPDAGISRSLATLARLTAAPERADRLLVSLAFRHVSASAEVRDAVGTAAVFAHAAAVVCPGGAGSAY